MHPSQDIATLAAQLGRDPHPPARVVARCGAGRPVAVEQPARTPDGAPFPTVFWLTCPGLVRGIARLEAAGGVRALEARIAEDPALTEVFAAAQRRHAALRPPHGPGIGGVARPQAVKCLHAHAAFALGAPPYSIGDALIAEAGGIPSPCCMEER
jgi:hypothetical protein